MYHSNKNLNNSNFFSAGKTTTLDKYTTPPQNHRNNSDLYLWLG